MNYRGIDVHQNYSEIYELSEARQVELLRSIPTTARALQRLFGRRSGTNLIQI